MSLQNKQVKTMIKDRVTYILAEMLNISIQVLNNPESDTTAVYGAVTRMTELNQELQGLLEEALSCL